ncbi:hypothetical protein ABI59_05005 [Acidobacteria bacterium Mor1]|nr:hypothetical protein ABI59_05005 [Acidobacteria bacterium Mor1]
MAQRDSSSPGLLCLVIATGFGTGYAPIASGTFGSLPGLLFIALLNPLGWIPAVAGTVVVTLVGIWAAERASRAWGQEDPGRVVADEIAGQMVTLLFVPITPWTLIAGFLLFRLFDIVKPPPARQFEKLHGGVGIMADDLMAGVYANLVLQLALYLM